MIEAFDDAAHGLTSFNLHGVIGVAKTLLARLVSPTAPFVKGRGGNHVTHLPERQQKRCNKKPEGSLAPQEISVAAPQQLNNICATVRVGRAYAAIPPYNKTTSKALAYGWEMSGLFCFDPRW
jgi:hypothetical protein